VLHLAVCWILAATLVIAAVAKLANPSAARGGMATFGLPAGAWVVVVAVELALAAGVAAGLDAFAWAAAGVMTLFAGALGWALARGRGGRPCACFGARSRVSGVAVARNAVLAAGFAALPFLPAGDVSTETWLAVGLAVALVAVVALAVAVLALAREVGLLKMAVGAQGALEIPDEGPPLMAPSPLVERFTITPQTRLALAVFASEGCHLCRQVAPSVELLARERWLAVETFDEVADADAWAQAAAPGSPYAVALDPSDGTVLAKGTFNGLAQLESVLQTAEQRALEAVHA
jgi:hypothetical protein